MQNRYAIVVGLVIVALVAVFLVWPGAGDGPDRAGPASGADGSAGAAARAPAGAASKRDGLSVLASLFGEAEQKRFRRPGPGEYQGAFLGARPIPGQPKEVHTVEPVDRQIAFEPAEVLESGKAQAYATHISDAVLRTFDVTVGPEMSAQIEVSCEADGRRCRFEGPVVPDLGARMMRATLLGDWSRADLDSLTFDHVEQYEVDGEQRFIMVASMP